MNKERKAFQHLPVDENPQFEKDAKLIYIEMRKKYPNNSMEDLDNILNGICGSLVILMRMHVSSSDHKQFLQLIWSILNKNIEIVDDHLRN